MKCSEHRLCDCCSSGFRKSIDSVLKASGDSDVDEAVSVLWNFIKEVWWWIDGDVCVRSYCLHKNIYPTLMPFSCHQYRGTGSDLGVGRILHQSKFLQRGVCE